ncbi:MAG: putative toxin-antitoxin system toxin component, PIN family [Candidatus Aminicenantes bacterium]|nr:putative toxin-antitoxin system toxin component, PIN family [Candidatus Aminicenantes bacterium]
MFLVVDTNVMVESITRRSPYHKIFQSIVYETNSLVISNEIMLEYFEIFGRVYSERTLREITIFFEYSTAIMKIEPHYRFRLIGDDEDDNKFVDCAICGNCDFLVTSDHHFNILKKIDFPKVMVISPEQFIKMYL